MKQIIKKILKKEQITEVEFNTIIADYIKEKKGKEPTVEQLQEVVKLIQGRLFTLDPMVEYYTKKYNLQVVSLIDLNTGSIKRIDVYE